ncbi:MAG TPA: hypothetical protein VFH74_06570 [Gaiellales bacterium]|nr:hypothetical protein [Gaiellales bacterium]
MRDTRKIVIIASAVGVALAGSFSGRASAASQPATQEVSVSTTGIDANRPSRLDAVSPDGRYVLFDSTATNLVAHDTNAVRDVFLRDVVRGRTVRVSVGPHGRQGNAASWGGSMSSDGRYITFQSAATNLSRHDTNGVADAFLRIRGGSDPRTVRVSIRPAGGQFEKAVNGLWATMGARPTQFVGASLPLSADGRYVAFGVLGFPEVAREYAYLRDRKTHRTVRVFRAKDFPVPVAMSADGRFLVAQNSNDNGNADSFFLRDRGLRRTTTVPYDIGWLPIGFIGGIVMSPDARYFAFSGYNGQTVPGNLAYRWQRGATSFDPITPPGSNQSTDVYGISDDGRYVGANGYRFDMTTQASIPASVSADGTFLGARGLLSGDAAWYAFAASGGGVTSSDSDRSGDLFIRGPLAVP